MMVPLSSKSNLTTTTLATALIYFQTSSLLAPGLPTANAFLPSSIPTTVRSTTATAAPSFGIHHPDGIVSHGIGILPITHRVELPRSHRCRFIGKRRIHRSRLSLTTDDDVDDNGVVSKPKGWEERTANDHLTEQKEEFDERSSFFASDEAVDEEILPVLTHLGKRVVEQMVQSRADGEPNVDDGEDDEDDTAERKTYKILDVACGTGALFPYYIKAANDAGIDLSITALDLCPKMIALAKAYGETVLKDAAEDSGGQHRFHFVEGDFVRTILGEGYETDKNESLIGRGDGVEDESTQQHSGVYDAVVLNSCFGNFYDQVATTTAACQSLKPNGIFVISHPLGSNFVRQLNANDPSVVPHHLPSLSQLRSLTRTQPLAAHSVLDEEINLLDNTRKVRSYPFYYATTTRVPHRSLRDVIRFRAPVARGYGRGGKKLGFPTANLESSDVIRDALVNVPTGVYFGWAVLEKNGDDDGDGERTIGRNTWHRAVVNVGLSPTFEGQENGEKIVEAHLMLDSSRDIEGDFYGETMRLALSGFLRPERKFPSFPDLIAAINADVVNAKEALGTQLFVVLRTDPFLADVCRGMTGDDDGDVWVGSSGGDETASYEFQNMEDAIADTPMGPLAV